MPRTPASPVCGQGVNAGASVYSDGVLTLARGYRPVVKTDTGDFLHQYLTARTFAIDDDDTSFDVNRSVVLTLTPLRP